MTDPRVRDPRFADIDRLLDGPEPDEAGWYDAIRARLEAAYLAAGDPRGQSGMRADAARWERGRRPIVSAIDRDGTFLDVGCANGLLMESIVAWAAEAGHTIEPYGLDYSPAIVDLARRRLPRWAERMFIGNVIAWAPPRRFDFVRTELVYAPLSRQQELVERLLGTFLSPGGRLILCSYGSSTQLERRAEDIGSILRGWGFPVAGEADGRDDNGVIFVRVAWVDAPLAVAGSSGRDTFAG